LIIACGATAREFVQVQKLNGWHHVEFQCLPAELHNTPEKIPGAVQAIIDDSRRNYDRIFVGYADCGTGGLLDAQLEGQDIDRLPGAHCYDFYSGPEAFAQIADEEPGTFYLTDFLVHAFDRLVREGLGLNRHPELKQQYFGNYRRVVYLAQRESPRLQRMAREQAAFLGLDYAYIFTGLDPLKQALELKITQDQEWQN
jgi:hypothetical protein